MTVSGPIALIFVPMLLWMGFTLLGAGAFTTYFGAGKSRTIGVILLLAGVVEAGTILYLNQMVLDPYWSIDLYDHILGILGAVVGGIVAVAVFLFAIMKS